MHKLLEIQKWLGSAITKPPSPQQIFSLDPKVEEEAPYYIASSSTLSPIRRLEIYHQQYWWRLIKCLITHFPTVTRLFGYIDFRNKIAIPYLSANPSQHWSLERLGDTLPEWLKETYQELDRYLVVTAAEIDWATIAVFSSPSLPFIEEVRDDILSIPLILQPYVQLFDLKGDFFIFRELMLKQDPDFYNKNPFPMMSYEKSYFVLYRTPQNMVTWKKLSHTEFEWLSCFKKRCSIEEACERLEAHAIESDALEKFPFWFKEWTVLKWFGLLS